MAIRILYDRILICIVLLAFVACSRSTSLIDECNTVLDTDRAFSAYSQTHGMAESFYRYAWPQAVLLRNNQPPVIGNTNIKSLLKKAEEAGAKLSWEPQYVDVSGSRDMAYTYGYYHYISIDSSFRGCYVSIWKKDKNRAWKFVLDAGTSGLGER